MLTQCRVRLEEFLRRRARLQRVEEEVRRRIVLGFFDMLYYSRQFKRRMELKKSARMTAIPQLDVPEILVDNEEDRAELKSAKIDTAVATSSMAPDLLSPVDTPTHHRSWSGMSADLSSFDTSYGHPLASPRASGLATHGHRNHASAFSFELHEPIDERGGDDEATRMGQRGSSVSPDQVREMLDGSAWMTSIRRSATMKRNNSTRNNWGGQGGY